MLNYVLVRMAKLELPLHCERKKDERLAKFGKSNHIKLLVPLHCEKRKKSNKSEMI